MFIQWVSAWRVEIYSYKYVYVPMFELGTNKLKVRLDFIVLCLPSLFIKCKYRWVWWLIDLRRSCNLFTFLPSYYGDMYWFWKKTHYISCIIFVYVHIRNLIEWGGKWRHYNGKNALVLHFFLLKDVKENWN